MLAVFLNIYNFFKWTFNEGSVPVHHYRQRLLVLSVEAISQLIVAIKRGSIERTKNNQFDSEEKWKSSTFSAGMAIAKPSPVATGLPLATTLLSTRRPDSFQRISTTG